MKRHPSLHPLSEHHHALVRALGIRRAENGPEAERSEALRRVGETFIRFWKAAGQLHFREEEEILLPAYARHARLDENPQITRMLAEHALIWGKVEQLEQALEAGQPAESRILALGRLLQDHARLEEDEIFPHIEAVLGEQELTALGDGFTCLHNEN
jgi:hemerythrin-like domain-containing protein